jgi:hypothetical protein
VNRAETSLLAFDVQVFGAGFVVEQHPGARESPSRGLAKEGYWIVCWHRMIGFGSCAPYGRDGVLTCRVAESDSCCCWSSWITVIVRGGGVMNVVVKGLGLCGGRRRGRARLLATLRDIVGCTGARTPFSAGVSMHEELAAPYSAELPSYAMVSHPSYS